CLQSRNWQQKNYRGSKQFAPRQHYFTIHGCDTAPAPTGFAEIVSDGFQVLHCDSRVGGSWRSGRAVRGKCDLVLPLTRSAADLFHDGLVVDQDVHGRVAPIVPTALMDSEPD